MNEPQSLRVPSDFDALREVDYIRRTVRASAATALRELDDALRRGDLDDAASALKRLASAGELGRLAAQRIERRPL